jgi:SAM-dependent methyltransferase
MAEAIPAETALWTPDEAAAVAAALRPYLPVALAPALGPAFLRSSALFEEFIHRLVLRVVREAGIEEAARAGGTSTEIAARAGLDQARAPVPVDWMLRHLAARGRLEVETASDRAPVFRLRHPLPALDPAPVAEEQTRYDAAALSSYVLAETVARDYPAFLHGRITGEAILFSPARLRLWVEYFSNDNALYVVNNRVGGLALAEWMPRPAGGVVELGGGLGSGAVAALEALTKAGRLGDLREYRFTELIPAFLRRGEAMIRARFPEATFLTAAPLDMNRPFGEQGIAPGSASAVYAVNTLHVAHDLGKTLGEILRALAPGGRLVAGECLRPLPGQTVYAEFIFNLMEAFRAPRLHPCWRPNGGFLTPEQWAMALEAAGFVDIRFLPDVREIREVFPPFSVGAIGAARPPDAV